ncbi:MAG: tyrosine--tRNA ligase [Bdellovibrionales bacterium]|nr:tyrosine--tRNA ligase [Bdellovibrionales bacterium]
MSILETLRQRGFIYQTTHDKELEDHLATPRVFYVGFDPTADSLHVGSLIPLMAMVHMQKAKHIPIAIVGGGTARVGDPSGKTELRKMLSEEELEKNTLGVATQIKRYLNLDGKNGKLVNNKDWLLKLGYIEFLRDIGRHFSINRMLTAESVKMRLEKGLSFIEFNYSLLQAYDFYTLLKDHNCTVQMGGQDQWGNIVAGDDLCRRMGLSQDTFGMTFPLLMNSNGTKFGKSQDGNIWLDINKTPALEYYQFFRNTADQDVEKLLKLFTFLPIDEILRLIKENLNRAKEILAFEATSITHGSEVAASAYATAVNQFGSADPSNVVKTSSKITTVNVKDSLDVPTLEILKNEIQQMNWAALVHKSEFASSKGEARRLIQGKGVKWEETTIEKAEEIIPASVYASGSFLLKVGKKKFKRIQVK